MMVQTSTLVSFEVLQEADTKTELEFKRLLGDKASKR